MPEPENGWYQDPGNPGHHRYWTGEVWQSEGERLPSSRQLEVEQAAALD